jgi:hypothetical protein
VLAVVVGGTEVPLPKEQEISAGFVVDGTNTELTVLESGYYTISYKIRTTVALALGSRVMRNGSAIAASILAPLIGDEFSLSFIINLTAGDVLTLELFGLLGAVTLQGGVGAFLQVIKLA